MKNWYFYREESWFKWQKRRKLRNKISDKLLTHKIHLLMQISPSVEEYCTKFQDNAGVSNQNQGMKRVFLAMGFHDRGFRRGALNYANQAGWSLDSSTSIACVLPPNENWDGVVALPAPYSPHLNEYLAKLRNTPIVYADPLELNTDHVAAFTDHRAIGHQAAEFLIDQGFRHIAFCGGSTEHNDTHQRRQGVREACEILGIPLYNLNRGSGENMPWDEALTISLAALPKPLGICTVNDRVADIVIRAALRLGLHIPDDVSIIGADNDADLCELAPLGISSIEGNTFKQAVVAFEMLDHWMTTGSSPIPHQVVVPPGEVIERESTGFSKIENSEIGEAILKIERSYADKSFTAYEVIAALPYKKSTAYSLFQKECGTSIAKFITKRRLRQARLLLVSTEMKLCEVAERSGFGNSRHLADAFKRVMELTPTEYREKRSTAVVRG